MSTLKNRFRRFLDEKNRIVGLRAKGLAKKNPNDFIVRIRT